MGVGVKFLYLIFKNFSKKTYSHLTGLPTNRTITRLISNNMISGTAIMIWLKTSAVLSKLIVLIVRYIHETCNAPVNPVPLTRYGPE